MGGVIGFLRSVIDWLLRKDYYEIEVENKVDYAQSAHHIIAGSKEARLLCEETSEFQDQVKFHWELHSTILQAKRLPNDEEVYANAQKVDGAPECGINEGVVIPSVDTYGICEDGEYSGREQPRIANVIPSK